jgi:hypothetical protein
VGAALGSSLLCFSPVLWTRGLGPWSLAEAPANGLEALLLQAPTALLGQFGALALLLIGLAGIGVRTFRNARPVIEAGKGIGRAALVGVLIHAALYAVYPFEFGYLIPSIGFGVLLLARTQPEGAFRAMCVALAIAAFVPRVAWEPQLRLGSAATSPLLQVQLERELRMQQLGALVERANALPGRSVVVAGWLEPQLRVMWRDLGADNPGVEIAYTLDREELEHHRAAGQRIYYIPGQQHYNREVHGVGLDRTNSAPL